MRAALANSRRAARTTGQESIGARLTCAILINVVAFHALSASIGGAPRVSTIFNRCTDGHLPRRIDESCARVGYIRALILIAS